MLGTRRLSELRTVTYLDFAKQREESGAGPATILQDLSYIGTVLRHGGALLAAESATAVALMALQGARLTLGHAGRVGRPEERSRRPTDAELNALFAEWARQPRRTIPMVDVVLFAISTAMRLGEIINLKWSDLDEPARTIVIRARKHPTKKSSNDQQVPLMAGPARLNGDVIDPLAIMLRQPSAAERNGRIFPYAANSVSAAFTRAVTATKIGDLHFHDLRHDGASRLFEAGFSIEQVALVTGHRDWNMLRRYTQLRAAHLHEVHARLEVLHRAVRRKRRFAGLSSQSLNMSDCVSDPEALRVLHDDLQFLCDGIAESPPIVSELEGQASK